MSALICSGGFSAIRISRQIQDGHIVYVTEYRHSDAVGVAYLCATGLPLLLSSQRTVVVLGAIVLAEPRYLAYALYWEAFVSVWCFFRGGSECCDPLPSRMVPPAARPRMASTYICFAT